MNKMNVVVDQLKAKTLSGKVKWSYSYDDGYNCNTRLSDGTKVGIVYLNNVFAIFAHANIYFHTPDGNILSHSVNGLKCARLIKAITENPMSIDIIRVDTEKDRVSIENLLKVL